MAMMTTFNHDISSTVTRSFKAGNDLFQGLKRPVSRLETTAFRHALALLVALFVGVGGVEAQSSFEGTLKTGKTTETKTLLIEKFGTPTDIGSMLKDYASNLGITDASSVYARIYVASDLDGNRATDQTVATFSGIDDWSSYGIYGYVYNGTNFLTKVSEVKVSSSVATNIALVVSIDPTIAFPTDAYTTTLYGKKWHIVKEDCPNYSHADQFNPMGNTIPWWFRADTGIYDDTITFLGDTYNYDPGADGKFYIGEFVTLWSGSGERTVEYSAQTGKPWEIQQTSDGQLYLVLSQGGAFPYICCNEQLNGPTKYRIEEISKNRLVLTYDDDHDSRTYSWRFVLNGEEDLQGGTDPRIVTTGTNLFASSDFSQFTKPWGKDAISFVGTGTGAAGKVTFTIPEATDGDYTTELNVANLQFATTEEKAYLFKAKLKSNADLSGVCVKMDFLFNLTNERVPLTANEEYQFTAVSYGRNVAANDTKFYIDFGAAPANTVVEFYDLEMYEMVRDPQNLFAQTVSNAVYAYKSGGSSVTNDITPTRAFNSYSISIPASYDNNEASFTLSTSANVNSGKTYDYSFVIRSNYDYSSGAITVKLQDPTDNTKLLVNSTIAANSLKANRDYAFVLNGITGVDINNLQPVFDLGFAPTNGTIIIRNIVLKEHETNDTQSSIVKEPELDGKCVVWDLSLGLRDAYEDMTSFTEVSQGASSVTVNGGTVYGMTDAKTAQFKYARWYVVDNDGNYVSTADGGGFDLQVSGLSPIANSGSIVERYGQYWYSNTAQKLEDMSFTFTVPSGKKVEDYKVVAIVSTEPGNLGEGGYGREPLYDYRLTFGFTPSFIPEGSNISSVNLVKYKDVLYDKTNRTVSPWLFTNWREPVADAGSNYYSFPYNGYARWYLEDENGSLINMVGFSTGVDTYVDKGQYGYYQSQFDNSLFSVSGYYVNNYDPVITLPSLLPDGSQTNDNYKKVNLVCVVTTTSAENYCNLPYTEPAEFKVKYIFKLFTEDDYKAQPFVHSKGASMRDYASEGACSLTQYDWNYKSGSYSGASANTIRQDVHTVEYDIYVTDEEIPLTLPFDTNDGSSNTEPMGYFRWYNFDTDAKAGTELTTEGDCFVDGSQTGLADRGFFALALGSKWRKRANQAQIGVKFKKTASTTFPIKIACDASRYNDGIDPTGKYLVHEPTLSVRYIFNIHKAEDMAKEINTNQTAWNSEKTVANMAKLYEENGLVVVSMNGENYDASDPKKAGEFSLRVNQSQLSNYYIGESGTLTKATGLLWKSYYEVDGSVYEHNMVTAAETKRVNQYSLANFSGNYSKVYGTTGEENITVTAATGMTFHTVGYITDGTNQRAVAHYELQFIDAKPLKWDELHTSYTARTEEVLRNRLPYNSTLNFDKYFSDDNTERYQKPTCSEENYALMPLEWEKAQYGYCYPQLYANNETNRSANWFGWNGFGISPLHADYTLLKSMYLKSDASNSVSLSWDLSQTYYAMWYRDDKQSDSNNPNAFTDITNHRDNSKYGTFLYVDAAEESRTIATLFFDAKGLCAGSEIYYTAYVADMTSEKDGNHQTPPQVMFHVYGVTDSTYVNDSNGGRYVYEIDKEHPIVSFLTGDLISMTSLDDVGKWLQVYGYARIPTDAVLPTVTTDSNGNLKSNKYAVVIDNYSLNTQGADYTIDEITFYACAASLRVEQKGKGQCDEDQNMDARFYITADNLQSTSLQKKTSVQKLYYKIFDEDGNAVTGVYANTTVNSSSGKDVYTTTKDATLTYGTVEVITDYTNAQYNDADAATPSESNRAGFYVEDGEVIFRLAWDMYPFEVNKNYYMSLYDFGYDPTTDGDTHWGSPKRACSTYSDYFIARKVHVTLMGDGIPIDEVNANCDGLLSVDLTARAEVPTSNSDYAEGSKGYTSFDDLHYDFFIGSIDEYKTAMSTVEPKVLLSGALYDYRNNYPDAVGLDEGYKDVALNENYYKALVEYVSNGKLVLGNTNKLTYEFMAGGTYNFVAIPIELFVEIKSDGSAGDASRTAVAGYNSLCLPIPFEVTYNSSQPRLVLGFQDVEYPLTDSYRTIRIGREQMENLQNDFILHVPVKDYADKTQTSQTGTLTLHNFTLYGTNDPTVAKADLQDEDGNVTGQDDYVVKTPAKLATFGHAVVDASHMYVSLNFHETGVTKLPFREGYEYKMLLYYHDETDDSTPEADRCESVLPVVLKIVPEYVTMAEGNANTNWQNDEVWTRSKKSELYKTAAQYTDNGEGDLADLGTDQPKSYVPMKFTYVTLPTDNQAPRLVNLTKASNEIYNTVSNGTDASTPNIQYDIMVRYSEKECLDKTGHDVTEVSKTYDCEKFYGNICKEIYFKPGAELMNQQYLTYDQAWVEKELKPNTWYIVSSPLQETYAGDMYVPTENGRQETEAFKAISFNTTDYSRVDYPIYQRTWGKQATVVLEQNDARTYGGAQLDYDTVDQTVAQWGHTYNDVAENYNQMQGFSIRAHREDGLTENALIRLPKADTSYDYYNYNDGQQATGSAPTFSRTAANVGRLVYDIKTTDKTKVGVTPANMQSQGDYYLIGNPFMASIDMKQFFDQNGITDQKERFFWTYEASTPKVVQVDDVETTLEDRLIKPMQSFFIERTSASGVAVGNLKMTPAMTTDGNTASETKKVVYGDDMTNQTSGGNDDNGNGNETGGSDNGNGSDGGNPNGVRQQTVVISATNEVATTTARVVTDGNAQPGYVKGEDIETLFDSNLSAVPMVYTVAGSQAVSIDRRPAVENLPFGVVCTESDQPVEVTFSGLQDQGAEACYYVLDAATGETVSVTEGGSLTIQPNDYGRYFLTTRTTTAIDNAVAADDGIIVSVRGREVTVIATEPLSQVRIFTTGGNQVAGATDCGTETTLQLLTGGVYIIEAKTAERQKTVKVVVK